MDESEVYETPAVETVGQTLKAAREAQGKSVEDIAAATRIPTRHLTSLENSEWDKLPAPTYSVGFAKAYAGEVGLDRAEISERLRDEMGGYRPAPVVSQDYFTPTDPKRSIPIGLIAGVLVGLLLLVLGLNWLLNRDLNAPDNVPATENAIAPTPPAAPTPQIATSNVTLAATDAVWVDIRDGQTVLKQGELAAGEKFEVPLNAVAPTIATAKPEALTINVGTAIAPPIGPAGRKVTASLKGADLLRAPAAPSAPSASAAPSAPRPAPRRSAPSAPATAPAPTAPAPAEPPPAPAGNATGQ